MSQAASVRLGMVGLFLPLAAALTQFGHSDWQSYVAPIALYAMPTAALFAFRKLKFVRILSWPAWLLDVAVVYWLQHQAMPVSPFPAGVAGFTLGIFTLLVSLSASSMSRLPPSTTAAAATVFQAMLMREAGLSVGPIIAAGLILAFTALVNFGTIARLRGIVLSLTQSEVAHRIETERFHALDAAKKTIEEMFGQAQVQNAKLVRLQEDKDTLMTLLGSVAPGIIQRAMSIWWTP